MFVFIVTGKQPEPAVIGVPKEIVSLVVAQDFPDAIEAFNQKWRNQYVPIKVEQTEDEPLISTKVRQTIQEQHDGSGHS